MTERIEFQPASDRSLLVRFGAEISLETNQRIRRFLHLLQSRPIAGVRNLKPAYCSLLIDFDPLKLTHGELAEMLQAHLERLEDVPLPEPRQIEIPVVYGGEFGPDLNDVASMHQMTPAEVVELHASVAYVVYFLGFVPGFAYLGELPKALATPRLDRPRGSVPAGSVGIAGMQTGVYPLAVPGGWRLIGRTPAVLFRGGRNANALLSVGDRVRFRPISATEFSAIENG
ncbi:MAG TPA: 5-oxoprolinase subunit PxpB [Candidatus Aquilonibacter sp.]|nr:5-oxoprolinase subunit PxpB [Candidatus Aquilonibacter sp.]